MNTKDFTEEGMGQDSPHSIFKEPYIHTDMFSEGQQIRCHMVEIAENKRLWTQDYVVSALT